MAGVLRSEKKSEINKNDRSNLNIEKINVKKIGTEENIKENTNEIESLFQKSYDFNSNFVLFPVRNHSPLCCFHLLKTIEEYEPEAILIEGPQNAQDLIPYITSEKTKAPFCIYLSYDDKKAILNEEQGKYRAFFPFLDYSPELQALWKGIEKNIHCEFIDLSYAQKLINTPDSEIKNMENYENDRLFLQSGYYKMLMEKTGCKSFNELWEMLFEINGFYSDTKDFVRSLFYYCYFSRKNTAEQELMDQGNIIREHFMAENIKNAIKKYKKVLVVTGGIHTISLIDLITAKKLPAFDLRKIKDEKPGYLMPYSFRESDRNYGYESGMIFPYFYQKLWENIKKNVKKPFENTVLNFIINTASTIRKKQPLSVTDEMQSLYMAKGLAELREKKECGVFELIDGIKAAFVKGEINSYQQPAIRNLYLLLTGMGTGSVDEKSGTPPLVNNFFEKCKKYKISTSSTTKKETKLDIFNNQNHLEKSQFFHQMSFLKTDFCNYLKSQETNLAGKGRILLRETWEYRFSANVTSILIENSVYGGTVKEAVLAVLVEEISANHNNAKELSEKLVTANYMGLDSLYSIIFEKLEDIIVNEMNFLNISECIKNLYKVKTYTKNFNNKFIPALDNILNQSINRFLTLIYTVKKCGKEDEDGICDAIKFLYSYFINEPCAEKENIFIESLDSFYRDNESNSALSGISTGILYKKEIISLVDVMAKFNSFLNGVSEAKKMSAAFLKGFFNVAKDTVFIDDSILKSLNDILEDIDSGLFLEILPDLRYAFTYFLPFEIDKIAKQVSFFYDVSENVMQYEKAYNQEDVEKAILIDKYCDKKLKNWF